MSDISEQVANFSAALAQQHAQQNQPWTEMVNQRIQRIQELERVRQERSSSRNAANHGESRHSRREVIIHQTTRQDRRNQRPPLRSQSFDLQPTADGLFHESFESARQNLFGSRQTGSNENLYGLMSRRDSDTILAQRALGQQGSDSGSDSSIPSTVGNKGESNMSGMFNSTSPLLGSDSSLNRGSRSSSLTREARDSSVNRRRMRASNIAVDSSLTSRLYSAREGRSRDSRRRRTLQGSDRNVAEALEREKITFEPFSRLSPNFMASSDTDLSKSASNEYLSSSQIENSKSHTSEKTSYYKPTQSYFKRTIVLNHEDTMPIIAFEREKVIFVHSNGKIYWLDKRHPLTRYFNSSTSLPEININPPNESEEELGIIESIDGEPAFRYDRMREICNISKKRSGDNEEEEPLPTGDEDRYQSRSYYTKPRDRPSIESYFSSHHVISLYDGIDTTVFEIGDNAHLNVDKVTNATNVDDQFSSVNGQSVSSLTVDMQTESESDTIVQSNNSAASRVISNDSNLVLEENSVSETNDHVASKTDTDTVTEARFENTGDRMFPNQQMLVRQTIVEHHLETDEDSYIDNHNEINKSVNEQSDPLMAQLEMIHDSAGMPLDTSHLDYEELQMIHKALAESSSPSPPASPLHSLVLSDQSQSHLTTRESIVAHPELGTILESPGKLKLPSMDFSPMEKDRNAEHFKFSPTDPEKCMPGEQSEQMLPELTHGEVYDAETDTYTEVYEEEITIPFYPKSPKSPSKSPNSDTRSPSNSFSVQRTVTSNNEPLTIDIPENSLSCYKERSGSGQQSNSSNVSPLVKSEKGSNGTHSELSPCGSETFTTVFEEFVSTIPHSMLDNWSPK